MEKNKTTLSDEQLDKAVGGTKVPYTVRPGDSLVEIAKKFRCTEEELLRWNALKSPEELKNRKTLYIKF